MRISGIDFPSPLIDALRNDNLVIFAGAGVSVGTPACLPDFRSLAEIIAEGTGESLREGEREDRFLGRLCDDIGVDVYMRAVEALSRGQPAPTDLHRDLLRLNRNVKHLRVVTTNFDLLFEAALHDVSAQMHDVYRAPALPLGRDFAGIVHVHGALDRTSTMVLTDADFGLAYLNDGWARRFLLELFRSFTVLFVGYSHSDTIMTYLARALPSDGTKPRFALTTDAGNWRTLGIESILYPDSSNHEALHEGIRGLADFTQRGVLDWRQQINGIAQNPPSLNEEEMDLIRYAVTDPGRIRFFTETASDSEWINWLYSGGHLSGLFQTGELTECQRHLAGWLSEKFLSQDAGKLFALVGLHGMCLNERFWFTLGGKVATAAADSLDTRTFSKWVSILLHSRALDAAWNDLAIIFSGLGKRCSERGLNDLLIDIFDKLTEARLQLSTWRQSLESRPFGSERVLKNVWEEHLKPNLGTLAESVIEVAVQSLNGQYVENRIWQNPEIRFDPVSLHRSSIEPSEYDTYQVPFDVLIDAARDSLEYLSTNSTGEVGVWCDRLTAYEAPILHRLATHVVALRTDLSADEKIGWLLARNWARNMKDTHEVFRVVEVAYADASDEKRSAFVESILDLQVLRNEDEEDEDLTISYRHNWLRFLNDAFPLCRFAKPALETLLELHPDIQREEAPTPSTHWDDVMSVLTLPVSELRQSLQTSLGIDPSGPDDASLLSRIEELAARDFEWGIDLADALSELGEWDTLIWRRLLTTWKKGLGADSQLRMLTQLDNYELHPRYAKEIAELLYSFVNDADPSDVSGLLEQSNRIAGALWEYFEHVPRVLEEGDWLYIAINHPAGTMAQYWCTSHSLRRKLDDSDSVSLSGVYLEALTRIVQDPTMSGTLGRSVLARNLTYLLAVDESWTRNNVIPFFADYESQDDYDAVWHGFLYGGLLNPLVAEVLERPFLTAVYRITSIFPDRRTRNLFIDRLAVMLTYFVDDPIPQWIPEFYNNAEPEDKQHLIWSVSSVLRGMTDEQQQELWNRWLRHFWENRGRGVPESLSPGELAWMLDCLQYMKGIFPEAVELTVSIPTRSLSDERVYVVMDLNDSSVSENHPEAVAKLLIYLGECTQDYTAWYKGNELTDKLSRIGISCELKEKLRELMARLGLS